MSYDTKHIVDDIRGIILRDCEAEISDEEFNHLACRVFAYQFENNAPYRRFCMRRGCQPSGISNFRDIPAVPVAAFKEISLACFAEEEAVNYFQTSGTTQGKQGRHYVRDYALYDASLKSAFRHFVLPDINAIEMLMLSVPPSLEPHSSLIHMLESVRKDMGDEVSTYYMDAEGLHFEKLADRLRELERRARPACLLGTSLAFGYFCDWCDERNISFRLSGESRLMDTGGSKRKRTEMPRRSVTAQYKKIFGLPGHVIINEYGMTELFSQYYDTALRAEYAGHTYAPDVKEGPPWLRTVAVNPENALPLPDGETGLLLHYDLANVETVSAIQTEDTGIMRGRKLTLLGRDITAQPRGCSLLTEEIMRKI